jgi:hypothetical protein
MTKRSRDSIAASSHSEPSDRQASNDAEAVGSQEDADGSALKKARSFMATLVSDQRRCERIWLNALGMRRVSLKENAMRRGPTKMW